MDIISIRSNAWLFLQKKIKNGDILFVKIISLANKMDYDSFPHNVACFDYTLKIGVYVTRRIR